MEFPEHGGHLRKPLAEGFVAHGGIPRAFFDLLADSRGLLRQGVLPFGKCSGGLGLVRLAKNIALLPEQILHARDQILDLFLPGIAIHSGGSPFEPDEYSRLEVRGEAE